MKYMLLIYNNAESRKAIEENMDKVMAEVGQIMAELQASGEFVDGMALAGSSRTVQVRDGVPVVTDGPFLESKELMAGYVTVDVESLERATEIAARWPDAALCAMEIRPVIGEAG
ncbi:YciI family protein [Nonomuraea typhae]|uniref:YciI family protein n=1 Tax=Nonomuraea typhae TaxID=2603600 RepID=UPI0012FC4AD4|nr:YciI family protein [Nonomuraea typhae]